MGYRLGNNNITSSFGTSYINIKYLGEILLGKNPSSTFGSFKPVIYNFRIDDANKDRVLFDSLEPLSSGSTHTGFTISNKTINGVSIATGLTTGHYFTVSVAFDHYDNNTIRYEGVALTTESNISDGTDGLYDFTLSYITNNISEVATSTNRYVTTSGSALNGGTSEADSWTIEHAFANQAPGMTIWVKAGNYGQTNYTFTSGGTAANPIRYIGYKTSTNPTVRDIITNYWAYPAVIDTTEMPTFTGDGTSTIQNGRGIYLNGATYMAFESIQMDNYVYGVETFGTSNSFVHFKNVNIFDSGDSAWNAQDVISGNTNFRFIDCQAYNYDNHGINVTGDGVALFENCKIYNDDILARKPDYQITWNGDHCIARNCRIEIASSEYSASTHGIGVRGGDRLSNTYNLIEKSEAYNINESFYVRNEGCDYNVIKSCGAYNNGATSTYRGGFAIWGGADYNVVEFCIAKDVIDAVIFKDNHEENILVGAGDDAFNIGNFNTIRNCIFDDFVTGVSINEQTVGGDGKLYDTDIVNCTFTNGTDLFSYVANLDVQRLIFTNCIFDNITTYSNGTAEGESFTYCNFWNFWGTNGVAESGVGNTSTSLSLNATTYVPTPELTGISVIGVEYDYNNIEDGNNQRDETSPTIGAIEI